MQRPDEDKIEVVKEEGDEDEVEGEESGEDESKEGVEDVSAAPAMSKEEALEKYKQARAAGREDRFDDALTIYESLLVPYIKIFGETSAELAELYYRLGRVYLNLGKKASVTLYTTMMKKKLEAGQTNPSFQFEGDESSNEAEGPGADELLDSAWKALEYARVTYEERNNNPIELSDVHLALGEFSQEMEQPKDNTLGEYRTAVTLRQSLPEDTPETPVAISKERLLAEAYYETALAHLNFGNNVEATDNFKRAAATLRARVTRVTKDASELEELKEIISDIENRIEELSMPTSVESVVAPVNVTPSTPKASAGPVNVITHLVRKRPTPSEPESTATTPPPPAKAPVLEVAATNGSAHFTTAHAKPISFAVDAVTFNAKNPPVLPKEESAVESAVDALERRLSAGRSAHPKQ